MLLFFFFVVAFFCQFDLLLVVLLQTLSSMILLPCCMKVLYFCSVISYFLGVCVCVSVCVCVCDFLISCNFLGHFCYFLFLFFCSDFVVIFSGFIQF